jgi:hypothetical protein
MTTPTQAQIEAARQAIVSLLRDTHTFADGESACWGPSTIYPNEIAQAALTAAAQVGETAGDPRWMGIAGQGVQIEFELRKELLTVKAVTIERCAQVAEQAFHADGREIAAAIRKLKQEEAP